MNTTKKEISVLSRLKGRAVYVFDRKVFEEDTRRLLLAFKDRLHDVKLGYSVKTNPHPAVVKAARENGMMAEVVSPHELTLAQQYGFSLEQVIYNGVIPDGAGRFDVAHAGGIVNIDNLQDLRELEDVAKKKGYCISVGIRINVPVGASGMSRFGIEYGSDEYKEALEVFNASDFINLSGVHSHAHRGRSLACWKERATKVCSAAHELNAKYVDFGSNMYGVLNDQLKEYFGGSIPTFSDYADVVAEAFDATYASGEKRPTIILEPGTPVIANAITIHARVERIRTLYGKNIAIANCSFYDFGYGKGTQIDCPPMSVISHSCGQEYSNIDIYGNTCVELDIVQRGYSGKLAVGDELVFHNMGAYSVSLSNHFISEPLPLIMV